MCGIAGVLAARGEHAAGFARAMHERLVHRGPDSAGTVCAASAVLCHRRLSIIDLSPAAAQPMWDSASRACVIFNGEIYNFRELRAECIERGAELRSSSDTEVLLNLYLLDGERAFGRLNGMFAFALVDSRTGESWLVRDPVGIKPLYWGATAHGIAFASELRALLSSGIVPFEVGAEALQAYLQLDFVPSPMSMVEGIRKLPGGSLLHVGADGAATERPYSRLLDEADDAGPDRAADVVRFDRVIRAAVERQMVADVPVGVFLSGGIDSSIVARAAADVAGKIDTFSIAFEDPSFDESRWFDMAARTIGSRQHTEVLDSRAMLDLLPQLAEIASEPLADGSLFPTILLARFTRRHVKVALSGDGADELFAGYPTHGMAGMGTLYGRLPEGLRRGIFATAHRLLPVSHRNLSLDFKVRKFLEGAHRDPVVQNQRWMGTFPAAELPGLLTRWDAEAQRRLEASWHQAAGGARGLETVLRTDRRFYLQDGVLVKVDRASMAASLEVRVPMLDNEMVRFANGLPADRKLHLLRSKWILREWAARHFPSELVHRPKKGFGTPLAAWFRGPLRGIVRDTLAPDVVASDGFFRPAPVQRLLEEHERGTADHRKRIFNLLAFTLWYRTWRNGR